MHTKRLWRSIASYSTFAALFFQLFGMVNPQAAHAATPQLRITEIHWAGSTGNAADEWVELKNVSPLLINFGKVPYDLQADKGSGFVSIATLGAVDGMLLPGQNLVLHRDIAPSATSTLKAVDTAAAKYLYKPTLELPDSKTAYKLLNLSDSGSVIEDIIADNDGPSGPLDIPFAGSSDNGTASMSRISPLADGTLQTSWYTASTMGVNFTPGTQQWGTPGEDNIEVVAPSTFTVSPAYTAAHGASVTVSGTAGASDSVKTTFLRTSYGPAHLAYTFGATASEGAFTITATGMDVARYTLSAVSYNLAGDASMTVNVPVMVATTDFDYVVTPTVSTVPTPTLAAYPAITKLASYTFNGTLDTTVTTYDSVEIMRNGMYYATVPAIAGAFTAGVTFIPNVVNTIQFFAVTSTGLWSMPAVATVTHDSTAPLAIDVSKVKIVGNAPGMNDTIKGLAGAAEAGTILSMYCDSAKTQLITTLIVAADGSFPITDIGDNKCAAVYMYLTDAAGNVSPTVHVDNVIAFANTAQSLAPKIINVKETQATVTWTPITGAVSYRLKYKGVGGAFGAPINLCSDMGTCTFSTTVINLNADTDYVFAIAAVDAAGNESAYMEAGFHSLAPTPVITVAPVVVAPVVATTTPRKTDTVTKVTPTPTPAPSASPTPADKGDVKSATTDTTRNWTPWIILGVLVGIAVLATSGYFYWFGGEVGEMAMAGMILADDDNDEKEEKKKMTPKKAATPPDKPAPKDKRW